MEAKKATRLFAIKMGGLIDFCQKTVELSRCAEPSIECITLIEPAKLKDV
jgi:hypothetical protein|tara:strand:+ start:4589 stop:4738 length:150 start_codon:yes stop_codon:yes gene_type:complete